MVVPVWVCMICSMAFQERKPALSLLNDSCLQVSTPPTPVI